MTEFIRKLVDGEYDAAIGSAAFGLLLGALLALALVVDATGGW